MGISHGINQLNIDAHLVVSLLNASLENVPDAELLRDVAQIWRRALESLQLGHLRQPGENLVLNAFGEIRVIGITTKIIEWQHGDRFRLQLATIGASSVS